MPKIKEFRRYAGKKPLLYLDERLFQLDIYKGI